MHFVAHFVLQVFSRLHGCFGGYGAFAGTGVSAGAGAGDLEGEWILEPDSVSRGHCCVSMGT